jgi:AraC family transcriptional regulator of adaptative response/methylated-DNA-[protein]-cysteine methyltransferase
MPETLRYAFADTPYGTALAAFTDNGLCSLELGDSRPGLLDALAARHPGATLAEDGKGLQSSMAEIVRFIDHPETAPALALDPHGTDFQKQVWEQLMAIPCGQTRTYSDVARALNRPEAVRAVASACAKNRIALFIPCHRVLRKDGGLGGFHWGVERKKALLDNERNA